MDNILHNNSNSYCLFLLSKMYHNYFKCLWRKLHGHTWIKFYHWDVTTSLICECSEQVKNIITYWLLTNRVREPYLRICARGCDGMDQVKRSQYQNEWWPIYPCMVVRSLSYGTPTKLIYFEFAGFRKQFSQQFLQQFSQKQRIWKNTNQVRTNQNAQDYLT